MIVKGNKYIQLDTEDMIDFNNLLDQLDWFSSLVKLDSSNILIGALLDAASKSESIEIKEAIHTIHRIGMSGDVIEKVIRQIK